MDNISNDSKALKEIKAKKELKQYALFKHMLFQSDRLARTWILLPLPSFGIKKLMYLMKHSNNC